MHVMKKLFALLPVFALLFAIGTVLAFHQPVKSETVKKAFIENEWVDITGKEIDVHYLCDDLQEVDCTAEFTPQGQMVPNTLVRGEYISLE